MRIHHKTAETYIHTLAASIGKDPASLENWRCLHVEPTEGSTAMSDCGEILQCLKEVHKDLDGDMVHCVGGDVFFISRSLHGDQLYELAEELMQAVSSQPEKDSTVTLYDLFRDWRDIREILLRKAGSASVPLSASSQYDFGEISALQEIFVEAKNMRRSRLPLQVLLVEDDPLTRRLVASGFKEEYALITAENAQEAIANYLLYAPDIVFLDIGLPDASGFDVLHKIIACDPDAYIIMFSGNSYLDNVNLALSAGAAGFVAKPFKKEKLRHYIQDSAMHHHKQA